MSTSFNSLSTGVTKDMTEALTKVDEKVGNFNEQVKLLNQSQEGITKILAGVKKYGTLAEYSLDALIKDLLPASQQFGSKAQNWSPKSIAQCDVPSYSVTFAQLGELCFFEAA